MRECERLFTSSDSCQNTINMAEKLEKKRSPNFSASDCILLCEVMGNVCKKDKTMSNHEYTRHRFTNCKLFFNLVERHRDIFHLNVMSNLFKARL